jgi:hypothetical protein
VGRPDPAAKVSLVRWSSSSDPFCSDLFGAHLHTPLAQAELTPQEPRREVRDPAHLGPRRERRPRQQVREHEELVRTGEQLGFDLMVCGQHFLGRSCATTNRFRG